MMRISWIVAAGFLASMGVAQAAVYPAAPNATVSVYDCGTSPQVAAGSSPFFGSVTPDPTSAVPTCSIGFGTTTSLSPFEVSVDGSVQDHIGPICTVQVQGGRVMWDVGITAAAIRFVWDVGIVGPRVAPKWITWACSYPWPPTAVTTSVPAKH